MSGLRYKPGDPNNPYDPAALTGDRDVDNAAATARMAADPSKLALFGKLAEDPEKMNQFLEVLRADAAEGIARGETPFETMMREKAEWAKADALSAKVKERGNAAFRVGDLKEAYICYTGCITESGHEPTYSLNRAAVCLKAKDYKRAEKDATDAEESDPGSVKALFRRAQARRHLGKLDDAEADLKAALSAAPHELPIQAEWEELKKLKAMPEDERKTWLEENRGIDLATTFDLTFARLQELANKVRAECDTEDA